MVDNVDRKTRSWMMSRITGKDTKPELIVRSGLHRRGIGFRLNKTFPYDLEGKRRSTKPDIVLKKYRTVILVNSCFWHWHEGCRYFQMPDSNHGYWRPKLIETRLRDIRNRNYWHSRGWYVATVWECTIRDRTAEEIDSMIEKLAIWIVRKKYRRHEVVFSD